MAATNPVVPVVKLGSLGLEVSHQGLGCMGMTAYYGNPTPEEEAIKLIHHAVASGVTLFDTADAYGPHTNELVLGKAIKGLDRSKIQIASKFEVRTENTGGVVMFSVNGTPEYVHQACEASLKRLGVDYIDLYYQHRIDVNTPIEDTVGAMKELVEAGKVKYLGLSEASASDIRRAHAVHPITAVQLEWSLWVRDVEDEIIPTCRELGIGIVCYSPLGRGFLCGTFKREELVERDVRLKNIPLLFEDNLKTNEKLLERVGQMAERKGCTMNQLALAWIQHQGTDVVPIPGTTKIANLDSNIASFGVHLSSEEIQELSDAFPPSQVAGLRTLHMGATYKYLSSPPKIKV